MYFALFVIMLFLQSAAADVATAIFTLIYSIFALAMGAFVLLWLAIFLYILVSLAITLWALYDVLTSDNKDDWKMLWAIVVFLTVPLGVILYWFIGRKERKAKK